LEYLIEYGLFLAKTATLVVAVIAVLSALVSLRSQGRRHVHKATIHVTHLNEEYEELRDSVKQVVLDRHSWKLLQKLDKKRHKSEEKERKQRSKQAESGNGESAEQRKKRAYVLNFDGDIAASAVDSLRQEITAVLSMAEPQDEVILRLESPGGMVHAYGLASSQLSRIKEKNIPLTICVDKVAASGGYMMACLADRLIAAPFAIVGSIGVLIQLPNFHRVLKKHDVDYETIAAGEYKTTLSTFGEITPKGREKVREEVQEMHVLFKDWVKQHRPIVPIDDIATGEIWVGLQAKALHMIDEIGTSDACIISACESADVYEIRYEIRKTISDKLGVSLQSAADRLVMSLWKRLRDTRFFS
jgi:serine protease SohB